jgi:lysyl-tRNA synthetase class 2
MASINELRDERLKKLSELKSEGIVSFPSESKYTKSIKNFLEEFDLNDKTENILVGRVMSLRNFGALAFARIFDGTESVQIVFEEEHAKDATEFFTKFIDLGDFVQVTGNNYVTKKGENSLLVTNISILTKSLLPLPDKHAGLQDEEEKMRKRYLDLLLNEDKRELFYKKAKFWQVTRNFFIEKGFLEVDTPTLEVTTGGAEARPFKTHHNDFDIDVYMRICIGELWQKRLMAAGFPKTFEIGRAYRNEGSSPEHLQEFTNCEFYMAYANYRDGMKLVQELYRKIAYEVFGKTKFEIRGHTFDLADEWREVDYANEILIQTGIDIWSATDQDIVNKLNELKVKYEGENRERLTDTLWKHCRKNISGPAFLINHPLLVAPLAKPNQDGKTSQVFQPILAGSEVGKGYSELNDPSIQRANFEQQQKMLEAGDDEAMMPEWDFVEMLEHGMPPTCGFGFGERLFAFLAGLPIRETQLFPLVKPKLDNTL